MLLICLSTYGVCVLILLDRYNSPLFIYVGVKRVLLALDHIEEQ